MAGLRRAMELALSEEDVARLTAVARSRTEPASRVERARILLAYRQDASFFAVGRDLGVHHQTVQRCVERAVAFGAMAALDDPPRPGRKLTITAEGQGARARWASLFSARCASSSTSRRSSPTSAVIGLNSGLVLAWLVWPPENRNVHLG